jgi:hypothetical protein
MDSSIFEAIYDEYLNGDAIADEKTQSEEIFTEKYIKPLLEKNSEQGLDMETMFSEVLAENSKNAFMSGVKMCMRFVLDCM